MAVGGEMVGVELHHSAGQTINIGLTDTAVTLPTLTITRQRDTLLLSLSAREINKYYTSGSGIFDRYLKVDSILLNYFPG